MKVIGSAPPAIAAIIQSGLYQVALSDTFMSYRIWKRNIEKAVDSYNWMDYQHRLLAEWKHLEQTRWQEIEGGE